MDNRRNITTSPLHDIENQYNVSPYRELDIHTSPIEDIENQLEVVRPKAKHSKTKKHKKKVIIDELYNKNKSFYIDAPPTELFSPAQNKFIPINKPIKKVDTVSNLSTLNTNKERVSSPVSWSHYKRTHMSPVKWTDQAYFPGGSRRRKKRKTKRNKKSRKMRKKTIRKSKY